jgi:Ca2+/H+ antiporter
MRNIDWSFPKWIFGALAAIGAASAYPILRYGSEGTARAAIMGAVLSTVNVLVGYAAIEYSFRRSTTIFLKYVLGGMAVRMMLMSLVIVLLIKVWEVDVAPLVWSMGLFYVVYLTLEVLFIQRKFINKQER